MADNLPSADDLDRISEEQAIADSTAGKTCGQCSQASIDFCKHCGQEFCASHQSKYNPKLCSNCVTDANTALEVTSVVDEDGAERRGRRFRLIGEGWPNSIQMIDSLTDEELSPYIEELSRTLKQCQLDLDYTKILHSYATYKQDYDGWSRANSARKRRVKLQEAKKAQGTVKLNTKSFRMKTDDDKARELAKTLGVDIATARQLMAVLGKAK